MAQAVEGFGEAIRRPQVKLALFYYAGHGAEIDWHNYLLPIDVKVDTANDLNVDPDGSVTITGWAFTGTATVTFHGVAASFTVDAYHQITALVPAGATTGPIRVTTPGGNVRSRHPFTVTPGR